MDNKVESLLFYLWNARSIKKNLTDFQQTLQSKQPHIACIVETWLKPDKDINIKGYITYRKDRPGDQQAGGVAILIKKELQSNKINLIPYLNGRLELLGISIECFNFKSHIFVRCAKKCFA